MYFTPFFATHRDVAEKETRSVTLPCDTDTLPAGTYVFVESYCDDHTCDCRKVMTNVVRADNAGVVLATIGYGWESAAWYTKWVGGDATLGYRMSTSYLEPGGVQTELARSLLELWKATAVSDADYVSRIKKHYGLHKAL